MFEINRLFKIKINILLLKYLFNMTQDKRFAKLKFLGKKKYTKFKLTKTNNSTKIKRVSNKGYRYTLKLNTENKLQISKIILKVKNLVLFY